MVKTLPANAGDSGSTLGSGRSPGEGNGNPLQDSCVGNPVDRGAWGLQSIGSQKSRTRLSDYKPPAISLLTLKSVSISVLLLNLSCCYKVHTCKPSFTSWVPLPWHHEYWEKSEFVEWRTACLIGMDSVHPLSGITPCLHTFPSEITPCHSLAQNPPWVPMSWEQESAKYSPQTKSSPTTCFCLAHELKKFCYIFKWLGKKSKMKTIWRMHELYEILEKEMQPTPIFLPRESHTQRSLAGCNP